VRAGLRGYSPVGDGPFAFYEAGHQWYLPGRIRRGFRGFRRVPTGRVATFGYIARCCEGREVFHFVLQMGGSFGGVCQSLGFSFVWHGNAA
jgi:hypothetical protein